MTTPAFQKGATSSLRRECFITIGATAAFRGLLEQALSSTFLTTLHTLSYSHLTVQCGPELAHFNSILAATKLSSPELLSDIEIKSFDFNKMGLGQEMLGCKASSKQRSTEGVVICHAGAGTILDAMRIGVPLVVVPNEELLDNHQVELAEELEKQGYVTYGRVQDLSSALQRSEERSRKRAEWPPTDSAHRGERGIVGVVDEELGYENRMRETLD